MIRRFVAWLRYPVPRYRPAVAMILLFAMVWGILLYTSNSSYAATYTFVQSSWTGGQSATTAAHPTNESGWNKYSAATNIAAGSTVGTGTYSLTKNENFSTTDTTADKDGANTNVTWNASTALSIPSTPTPVARWKFDEGSGVTTADASGNGNTGKLDSSLVGYWKFDEGSGTSATDSSGTGNTGTLTNSPTYSSSVPSGPTFTNPKSLSFSGSAYVNAGNSSSLKPANGTLSAWVYVDSSWVVSQGAQIPIIFEANSNTNAFGPYALEIARNSGGSGAPTNFQATGGTLGSYGSVTGPALTTNTWYHVAMTWNSNTMTLYVNGSSAGSASGSAANYTNSTGLFMGNSGPGGFIGKLDDVRLYNRVLSGTEITALKNGNETTANSPTFSSSVPSVSFTDPYSLSFDGSSNYVDVTGCPFQNETNSVSAWIYPTTATQMYIITGDSGTQGLGVGMGSDKSLFLGNPTTGTYANTAANAITLNTWNQIVVEFPAPFANWNTAKFYVNGNLITNINSGSNVSYASAVHPYVGVNNDGGNHYYFSGKIDDLRIYSSALTQSQVTTLAGGNDLGGSSTYAAQSIKVNSNTDNIESVTLTKTDTPGTGTVTYYASNDGGATFNTVTPTVQYNFPALHSDLRWKIVLSGNATVSSISLVYTGYYASADLTSSAYDGSDPTNLVAKLAWTSSGETSNETVKLQIRTSADGNTWSGWCGHGDTSNTCSGSNYFTSADNNVTIASTNPVRSGGDDRWFEYKITLASGGGATATVSNVTLTYVVNAPPEFNSTNGLVVSQITDSNDPNFGKVAIVYSIRDTDTSTGTTNPGFVTPSFEYNIGGGYVSIPSGNLSANATDLKAVDGTVFTTYTAYWDAKSQIANNYLTTAKVRVTLNDNEAANNTAQSVSANFTLDTKNPVVNAFTIDATQNQVTVNITDDTALQYMLSNNADFSTDGANATSGQWSTVGGTSANVNIPWTFAAIPNHPTVYLQVRDTADNVTSTSAVAPDAPGNMYIRDISDPAKSTFAMFVSWGVYSSVAGATFSKYEVYRSTDGSSYSLLGTITDSATNYYADFNLTQSQTYYYKIHTIDTNSDIGAFSSVVSQAAVGNGGGTDNTPPVISAVTVDSVQSTSAKISWTTDTLADSRVDYSIAPSTTFASGGQSVASFVISHTVTINNLTPNTNYLFKVRSTDPVGNTGTNDNDGAGFTFTTNGGPVISDVTESSITGNAADIVWNTDKDSDSFVTYSANADLTASTRVGSSSLVGGSAPFSHTVSLTGLSAGTIYYFFVESTDGQGNYSKDDKGGVYYAFDTPVDLTPPVISNITTPVIAFTAAVVIWQTDKPATTQMSYDTTSGNYAFTTTFDPTLTIFHAVALNDLVQNTKYYFVVKSDSATGVEAVSPEGNFTTGQPTVATVVSGGGGGGGTTADTTPPNISNIKTQNVTSFNADVSFTTDKDTIAIIQYGTDPTSLIQSAGDATYNSSHTVSLSGLTTGTQYTYTVTAIDKSGNVATSDPQVFTTKFFTEGTINISDAAAFQKEVDDAIQSALPSLAAPFIETPQVTNITDSTATVTWRTNVKAYSAVAYGPDDQYDATKDNPYATEVSDTTNKITDHSLDLIGLTPDTLYHFSVHAFTLPQLQSKSDDQTFVTAAPKIQANISEIKNDSFRATWTTASPATSVVEYVNDKTGETNQKSFSDKTVSHDVLVDGLTPGTTYEVNVFGINDNGNKISIASAVKVTTSVDVTPPKITGLKISSALLPNSTAGAQTIISWTTDEPANSTVFYKDGTALPDEKLPNKVEIKNDFVTDHAVVLSTLKPGGLYSIQVDSVDAAGNETLTPIRTIVVPVQAQSVLDIVFKNFEDTFQFLHPSGQ